MFFAGVRSVSSGVGGRRVELVVEVERRAAGGELAASAKSDANEGSDVAYDWSSDDLRFERRRNLPIPKTWI